MSGAVVWRVEDGGDVKESEAAGDREGRLAVYVNRGCLQSLPIA